MTYNKQKYNDAYNRANYTGISFRLSNSQDVDVLSALKRCDNLKAYICRLVREDLQKQRKLVFNPADRRLQMDYQKYPFEVLEDLPYGDRYSVGFAEDLDNALIMMGEYSRRQKGCGKLHVLHREYDEHVKALRALEVTHL